MRFYITDSLGRPTGLNKINWFMTLILRSTPVLIISNLIIYMKQSEFKGRYDVEMGIYVKKHICGERVADVFKTIGRKLFAKTVKEAAKTATKKAVKTAATKTGEYAGEKAGDNYYSVIKQKE